VTASAHTQLVNDDRLYLEATDGALSATLVLDSAMNYALAHNGVSPLRELILKNDSDQPVRGLNLEVELTAPVAGRIAEALRMTVPELGPYGTQSMPGRGVPWTFDAATFAQIDEAVTASVQAKFFDSIRTLRAEGTLRLLAHDEWWSLSIEESLAAFVTPRARAIQDLVSEASDLLGQRTGSPSLDGYQGGADRAMKIANAIYDAMSARGIRYINPPPSFENSGQKIRSPHEVVVDRWGTCLDLATTYAAALEQAGLNPVLVVCDGHAFSGHLLDNQQLPELVLVDPRMILNYVEASQFIPVETTKLCAGDMNMSFAEARHATRGWWTDGIDSVRYLIDVAAAHRVVRPLPAVSLDGGVRVVEVERQAPPAHPPIPAPVARVPEAPRARGGERPPQVYPPRVARWRSSLLDLSFRNPLLNMRAGRTSLDLHVPQGALGTVEDLLFEGRSLTLIPHDQLAQIHLARGARTAQDIEPDTLRGMLEQGDVHVACTAATFLSRLRGIQRRARTVLEETGANNLFVTLGMLEWEDAGRQARAPLFLLPVTLTARRGRGFTLQIDDGAYAQPNQCLLEKLGIAHGLSIPEFSDPETDESGIDLAGSLQAIRMALLAAELPFAIEESAHIALLQFSTLQLWQDLSENWEKFTRNPVVRHLVETPTDSFVDPAADSEAPTDAEASSWCPIPIDGSQLEAVSWAQAGRSFVLEGPPGTGKSQTITNLIANALAAGQTVLFVAEKQAALDVVRRRLDKIGLGDLCLNLHGKSQTPADLRKQLRRSLHLECSSNPESWAAVRAAHRNSVVSLSRYPGALHEPGGAGLSAWKARQSLITSGDGMEVDVPAAVVAAPLNSQALYEDVRELTQSLYDLGSSIEAHPWRLARITTDRLADVRDRIPGAIAELGAAVSAIADGPLAELLDSAPGLGALALVAAWLRTVVETGWRVETASLAEAARPDWQVQLAELRRSLVTLNTEAVSLLATFTPTVVTDVDLDDLLIRAKVADGKLFKGKARKAVLADLAPVMASDGRVEPSAITPTLEALIALRSKTREVAREAQRVAGIDIPDGWNPLVADAAGSVDAQARAIQMTVELVGNAPGALEVLRRAPGGPSAAVMALAERLRDAWAALNPLLESSESAIREWLGADRSLLAALRTELPVWSSDATTGGLVGLGRWASAYSHLAALDAAGLDAVAKHVFDGSLHPDEIEAVLRRSIARAALAERLSATALAGFDGVGRDRAIERFARGDDEMRRDMVAELPAKIVTERSFSPERLVGRVGELNRELGRQRGGQKIRELFSNYGAIIGEITPCLMMSPHSVARFLPAGALDIDLVVFDEASQIHVAEAIGAMGRAKAAVVVGDSKQMPPSNFAAVTSATDDEAQAELSIPSDMESILSEAVESNLPQLWLSWHYRSRHEALISFSNQKYYDGRLASFPRPPEQRSDLGVSWRRVDGTFERGGERVNRVEAAAIVEEIRARLARSAQASIGVVTFNIQQRDLILDLLEECADERVAAALIDEAEPLFVKNLENVQGDERDLILFSLAFSVSPDNGKLPLNFGPLIQAGGERRLNVAVTRARAQVVLFSSFDPAHIDLSRSSSTGLADLRSYMEMAERNADAPAVLRPASARDRHHEEVVRALRKAQLCVRERVGLSDFTVDIGVAATLDGPWVAVFLDGPDYAKRATVGDRESLPYDVLVRFMGWSRVERVWLPDWVRDRDEVIVRIVRATSEPPTAREPEAASPPDLGLEPPSATAPVLGRGPPLAPEPRPGPNLEPAGLGHVLFAASGQSTSTRTEPLRLPARMAPGAGEIMFVAADDNPVGGREVLDELARNPGCRAAVGSQIDDVVAHEAPVAATRLARIVGRRFGLQRVAAKRASDIIALLPSTQLERTPFGAFAWGASQDRERYADFRTAGEENDRTIDEIAPRELLNAMRYLAKTGVGISRDELIRETGGMFGYSRMATKTRDHLEAIIDHGVHQGDLLDDGVAVTVARA
jgi:hypothetical protein